MDFKAPDVAKFAELVMNQGIKLEEVKLPEILKEERDFTFSLYNRKFIILEK